MKTLSIVTSAALLMVTCAGSASGRETEEPLVGVRLTTGERGKGTSARRAPGVDEMHAGRSRRA